MRTPAFDLLKTHYDYLDNQSKGYDRTDCDKSSIYLYGIQKILPTLFFKYDAVKK